MIRVLHVFHIMGNGGIENFIMNYYRHIDREKIQFDFLTSVDSPGYFDEEIRRLGGRVFQAYPKSKNPIKNFFSISKIVKENEYTIVHRHTGSAIGNVDLIAAKHGGAKTLISHSHNTEAGNPMLHKVAKVLFSVKTEKFACSKEAGIWLFGKKPVENGEVTIIKNAIDTSLFKYNEDIRNTIRSELGFAENDFVIGHVGRFSYQKNHMFLIDVFNAIHLRKSNSRLVLVGTGEDEQSIRSRVKSLGLEESVLFLGSRSDVHQLLNAFDIFLFPSRYEGLGIVLIEAQANGLNCVVSSGVIPNEVDLDMGLIYKVSLQDSFQNWTQKCLELQGAKRLDTQKAQSAVKKAGYDINDAAKELERIYLSF